MAKSGVLCACGCGQQTNLITKNNTARGEKIGQPRIWVHRHKKHSEQAKRLIGKAVKQIPEMVDAEPFKINGIYCRLVPLNNGFFAIVAQYRYVEFTQDKWRVQKGHSTMYAYRTETLADGRRRAIGMHQQVVGFGCKTVDHRNGDGLHNYEPNVRPASYHQNRTNSKPHGKRRFKGSYWDKSKGQYVSKISIGPQVKHLGQFGNDELAAARAYDMAALEAFGPFARLNFPTMETA